MPVQHRLDAEVRRKLAEHLGELRRVDRPLARENQVVEASVFSGRLGMDRPVLEVPGWSNHPNTSMAQLESWCARTT